MLAHLRAQAGLEYLLTYGWAMVLVVTVASLVFFVFSVPGEEKVNFSAGGRQIVVKASDIAGCAGKDSATLLLQNASGGPITITSVYGNDAFFESGSSAIAVDGVQPPVVVAAGRQIRLEKIDAVCGMIDGGISIDYTDKDGYQRTEKIRGLGKISCCPVNEECPEQTEQSCNDLLDNDCDNKADCDDSDCAGLSECEMWCTTNDSRFPVKGGIKLAEYHQSQLGGNCLSALLDGRKIFLQNLSGQTLNISNASVSIGTAQHFDKYLQMANCAATGEFSSPECPEVDGFGGYREGFLIPTINGIAGIGEDCTLPPVVIPDSGEIQIETSEFYLCPIREYDCPYATDEMWRAHKSNPITITLNTSAGAITVYCYNFPVPSAGPTQCADGQQRDCPLQQGVCAGAKETCTAGTWPGCNAASYGALYEATETSCADLYDNDCDGKTDCDDADCVMRTDCAIWCTTDDSRFPVKGGIIRTMEINWCIEITGTIEVTGAISPLQPTTPNALNLSSQADNNCTNWIIGDNALYLQNLSGETINVQSASVSLGPSHFDDYIADSCVFWGRFSSDRCPDSNSGDKGGFSESFGVTSINGVPGSTQACNINTSISAGEEINIGISDFSYCANREPSLPPECECPTDEMLRVHKDNPITITLSTSVGTVNIYCYNFPA